MFREYYISGIIQAKLSFSNKILDAFFTTSEELPIPNIKNQYNSIKKIPLYII